MFRKITTNLMVEDVGNSVEYYRDVLGFDFVMGVVMGGRDVVVEWHKDIELDHAMMMADGVEVMFQSKKSMEEDIPGFDAGQPGCSLTLYVEVDDIDHLYSKIGERVDMVKDIKCTFYGTREFYIRDCNGYVIGFAETL